MNVLVVSAHPSGDSFVAALRDDVLNVLQEKNASVRHHDLYAESFDPVFTAYERVNHVGDLNEKLRNLADLQPYVENLRWCDTLILVYPTWWSGQPAILKGWIDRVFMNEVAWVLPEGEARIKPLLTNVRRLFVVATHGSSKIINSLQGESGKRVALRSIRAMFHPRVKTQWVGIYRLDRLSGSQCQSKRLMMQRRLRRFL